MAEVQTIYQALANAQRAMKVPKANQGRFGKSRSAEDILAAAKPACKDNGLTLVITDDLVELNGQIYVKATATVYDGEGKSISSTAHAWEGDGTALNSKGERVGRGLDTSQVTGVATSYARKYAMGGLFALDDTKDADLLDAHNTHQASAPVKVQPKQKDSDPATPAQKQQLKNMMAALDMDKDAMGLMVESVLNKPTVDTFADYKAIVKAMEDTADED